MIFTGVTLSALALLLLSDSAQCRRVHCKSDCCSFVEGFLVRLKELRSAYREIQRFYTNDDWEPLLNENVQQNINSPYGCHIMNEILRFYLDTILPTAVQKNCLHSKTPVDSIGNIFQDLKRDILKCISDLQLLPWRYLSRVLQLLYSCSSLRGLQLPAF